MSGPVVKNNVSPLLLVGVFAAVIGLAWGGIVITRDYGRVVSVWLPNAVVLALLLDRGGRRNWALLAAGFAGNVLGNLIAGDPPALAPGLAAANSLEILVASEFLRRRLNARPDMTEIRHLAAFSLAAIGAPLLSGLIAAAIIAAPTGFDVESWLGWSLARALGLLLITPALLICMDAWRRRSHLTIGRLAEWAVIAGIGTVVTLGVFLQSSFPFLFLVSPVVIVAAFRLGALGTALCVLVVSVIAATATAYGLGPIQLVSSPLPVDLLVLQLFLVVNFAIGLPVAALLAGRERAAAELATERAFSRLILENMRDVVFRTDEAGRWVFLNPAWETLTGYSVHQSLGWRTTRLLDPADKPAALATYDRIASGELDEALLLQRFTDRADRLHWIEVSVRALRNADGSLAGTSGNIRDVSEREKVLAELNESRMLFERLADLSPAGIFRTDAAGRCTYVNRAWQELTGMDAARAMGSGWADALHRDDVDKLLSEWEQAIAEGRDFRSEVRYAHSDGTIVWTDVLSAPERMADGSIEGFIGVSIDITDYKNAEEKLAEREERLRLLADNVTDAVFRLDLSGTCLYASPSARDVLGAPPAYLEGKHLLTRFHPDDDPRVDATFRSLAAGEVERETIAFRSEPVSGGDGWRWLEASCALLRDPESGDPREILASIRDITARKQLENELDRARVRAEEATTAKSRFLANMSHELRTPMNGVLGFAELLASAELAEEQRRQAQLIVDSGRAMMRLLDDILDASKIDAGQMNVVEEPVDVRHVLRRCVSLMAPGAEQKGLTLGLDIADSVPAGILGDSLRLRQIVLNLVGNAIKFTEQGEVRLEACARGERLEIIVTDTGIGIPPDRLTAIFEPFRQGEDSTARRFGGTGLGLSISRELARLMGGDLSAARRSEGGSLFTLELPLRAVAISKSRPATAPAGGKTTADGVRVLVAEDHEINQLLITAMLKRLGCHVDIAADGAEAVAMVDASRTQQQRYGLVLMDMQMPHVDGLAATRLIRTRGWDATTLPIVALTANASADDIAACIEAGMQSHLSKPVDLESLAAALRRWQPEQADTSPPATEAPLDIAQPLMARYAESRASLLTQVESALERGMDENQRSTLRTALHQLSGTAALFGDARTGKLASEAESRLARRNEREMLAALARQLREAS